MKLFGSCNFDIRFFSSTLGALSRPTSNLKFSFETRFDRAVLYFEGKVFLRVVSETRLLSTLVSDTSLMLIAKMKRLVLRHVDTYRHFTSTFFSFASLRYSVFIVFSDLSKRYSTIRLIRRTAFFVSVFSLPSPFYNSRIID